MNFLPTVKSRGCSLDSFSDDSDLDKSLMASLLCLDKSLGHVSSSSDVFSDLMLVKCSLGLLKTLLLLLVLFVLLLRGGLAGEGVRLEDASSAVGGETLDRMELAPLLGGVHLSLLLFGERLSWLEVLSRRGEDKSVFWASSVGCSLGNWLKSSELLKNGAGGPVGCRDGCSMGL